MKNIIKDFWVWYGLLAVILFGWIGYFFNNLSCKTISIVYFFLVNIHILKEHKQDWIKKYILFVKNGE